LYLLLTIKINFLRIHITLLLTVILQFSQFNVCAQTFEPDGIDSILNNPILTEKEKVRSVIASIRNSVTSYSKGNKQLKSALVMARNNNMFDEECDLLSSIARFSIFSEEFDSVYFYGNQHIDLLLANDLSPEISAPLGLIMSGYYYQNRFKEAINIFNLNQHFFEDSVMTDLEMQVYYSAAINYEQLDKIDSTIFYLNKIVLEIDPDLYFDQHLNITAVLLAVYSEYGFKQEADALVDDILTRKENILDTVNVLSINMSLGQHYQYVGDYNAAKRYLNEALEITTYRGFIGETSEIYLSLYEIEKSQQNYAPALAAFEQYKNLQDSINNVEIQIATQEFEEKYQNDKLRIENLEKTAEIIIEETERFKAEAAAYVNKRNLYIALLLMLLIVIIAVFWINTIRNKRKKETLHAKLIQEETERDLAENQLKALRSQMNPHFVFNAINSIQELILKEDIEQSYNFLITFSQLVRNTLEYSKKEFISLDDEVEYLNLYLSLEKLRFEDDFTYTIECKADEECLVPSIVLQPFVENALKHGLFHKEGDKNLTVLFYETDHLICEIIDNGIGREKSREIAKRRARKHNSFSTEAIAKRMEILSEKYDGDVYYEIQDLIAENGNSNGTKVIIHLPNVL
jgi:two-component system LytT family sensor kinase